MRWAVAAVVSAIGALLPTPGYGQHRSMAIPPSPRAQKLQLRKPFTLTYRAHVRGVLHNGSRQPYNVRMTLSYDGKRLLYRSKDLPDGQTITELYDGKETYEAETGSRMAMIRPGFDFQRLWLCPLPGVGIPHVPMFTFGIPTRFLADVERSLAPKLASLPRYISRSLYNAPNLEREFGMYYYDGRAARATSLNHPVLAAVIPSAGAPKVLWYVWLHNPAPAPGHLWEYFSHKRFAGVWLATRIRCRMYGIDREGGPNTLYRDVTYNLEEAVERPLEPGAYEPTTYLSRHANVTDTAGRSVRTFLYEPGQGSLEEQRRRGMDVSEQAARAARSPVNTGFVGLGVLAVVAAVWIIWRTRRIR